MRLSPPCVGNSRSAENRACTPVRLGTASPASDKKNVHRAGRVSGGLLNPSGGARNRPRNKSVFAQSENELNHNFAGGNEFRLTHFQKSFARVKGSASRGELFLPMDPRLPRQLRTDNR